MQRPAEIRSLTGLRGVAAVAVMLHHANINAGGFSVFRGQPFVDLFFVLSGYVLALVYVANPVGLKTFAIARFARIYPLHIVTALIMAAGGVAVGMMDATGIPAWINPTQALREITLTSALPYVGSDKLWNFPSWSISVEWWTYFTVFPLVLAFGKQFSTRWLIAICAVGLVAVVASLYLTDAKPTRGWTAMARGAVEFLVGYTIFRLGPVSLPRWTGTVLCLAVLVSIYAVSALTGEEAWFVLLLMPFLVWTLANEESALTRVLGSGIVYWLGIISFSIYLTHPIALNLLDVLNTRIPIPGLLGWVLATSALTLAGSALSYRLIERPIQRWIRNLFAAKPSHTADAIAASPPP